MLTGFLNINKPLNMTSSDVVVIVRGILRRMTGEKQKVGHLGTLDPMACGVLPIAVGNATRLFDFAQEKTKVYQATFKFGQTTDTLDGAGKIVETSDNIPSKSQIVDIIAGISGEIDQIPPNYSAKSINGKRAYDLAREGKAVELQPKRVRIDSIKLIDDVDGVVHLKSGDKKLEQNEYAFEIACGSGTYIRAIARDIACALGSVGYMTSLVRIKSGQFVFDDAISIENLQNSALEHLKPVDTILKDMPIFSLPSNVASRVLNGVLMHFDLPKEPFVVYLDNEPIGLGYEQDGCLRFSVRF